MTTSLNKSVRYRNRQKQKAVAYLGGKCVRCGYNKSHAALHFHHLDPATKDWNPSRLMSYRWELVKAELDKCELLCANCHAEEHAGITEYSLMRNPNGHRKSYTKTCLVCSSVFEAEKQKTKYCSEKCFQSSKRKSWPEVSTVINSIRNSNFETVARTLNVSSNAIRKFLVRNGVDPKTIK